MKKIFLPVIDLSMPICVKQKIFSASSQFEKIFKWPQFNGPPCSTNWKYQVSPYFATLFRIFRVSALQNAREMDYNLIT